MIVAENLIKTYEGAKAPVLKGVSFKVERGEVYTLLGPSGCGKTTSLRSIAGLETPDSGRILLDECLVFSDREKVDTPPERRNIGMVFQSYAIWPHMTVAKNVAYPLHGKGLSGDEVRRRVSQALEIVGLLALADRPSPNLSGGQQQRVALARAIVAEPQVLLLDEPLSNLDAKLREQMRRDLAALQRKLGHSTIYVTHDQEEALALSHRVALMRDGVIVEEGDPLGMYQHPQHPFTAAFLGAANFAPCAIEGAPRIGDLVEAETPFGRFSGVARQGEAPEPRLFFRPHVARLESPGGAARLNRGTAQVTELSFLGEVLEIIARRGDASIRVRVPPGPRPEIGAEIAFSVEPDMSAVFLPAAR
jgi:iron(III) transport system ATP-binding protein